MEKVKKLFNKNFVLLWQGQFISSIGNQAFSIAVVYWIKEITGSASLMGLVLMLMSFPSIIFGFFGGVIADNHSRKKIIVIADAVRGFLILILAFLMFYIMLNPDMSIENNPFSVNIIVVAITITGIVCGIIGSIFNPAVSASYPSIVPKDKLMKANSLTSTSSRISGLVGQGTGGVLFRILGAPLLILIDGVTYIISAVTELFIEVPQKLPEKVTLNYKQYLVKVINDSKEGFRYIVGNRGLLNLIILVSVINFLFTPVMILLPFYVSDFLLQTSDWYGFLMASMGFGMIVGSILSGVLKIRSPKMKRLSIQITMILLCSVTIFLGIFLNHFIAMLLMFLQGVFNGYFNINIFTILQIKTPEEIRGRVFGFMNMAGILAPIGMGLSGVVADLLDQNIPIIYIGSGALLIIVSLLVFASRETRDYLTLEADSSDDTNTGDDGSEVSP